MLSIPSSTKNCANSNVTGCLTAQSYFILFLLAAWIVSLIKFFTAGFCSLNK
jgi:hypothetical protein